MALEMLRPAVIVVGDELRVSFSTESRAVPPPDVARLVSTALQTSIVSATQDIWTGVYEVTVGLDAGRRKEQVGAVQLLAETLQLMFPENSEWPDFTMALGWHTQPGARGRTDMGDLEYAAKWRGDTFAIDALCERVALVARGLPVFSTVEIVVAAPSDRGLASTLARAVCAELGVVGVTCAKAPDAPKQQDSDATAEEAQRLLAGKIVLPSRTYPKSALIVDDLMWRGSTIREITQCLRREGVRRVYSLVTSKTVRYHRQA